MSTPTNDDRARGSRGTSQLEQLIFECLERMEAEGPAALESLCAAHPDHAATLRARMQALHAAGLIEATPDGATPFPERLGDFRLLQHLGGGGMGVV